jgi:hypothetical protein
MTESSADSATTADDRREPARLSPEEGRYPTAEEFVDRWHLLSREQQLGVAGRVMADAQAASNCFVYNHEAELAEVRAALVASIEREHAAAAEVVSLRGRLTAATSDERLDEAVDWWFGARGQAVTDSDQAEFRRRMRNAINAALGGA